MLATALMLGLATSACASSLLVDFRGQYFNLAPYEPAAVTAATGPLSSSDSVTGSSMTATANFGSLLVTTTSAASGLYNSMGGSKAEWQDSLTITGGSGIGMITLVFEFSGELAASDTGAGSHAYTTYSVATTVFGASSVIRDGGLYSNSGPTGNSIANFSIDNIPFTFGTPLNFAFSLEARSEAVGDGVSPGAPFSASASVSNLSLTLASIQVSQPGAIISSESNTVYGVPESSPSVLLMLGLTAFAVRRRH